MASDIKRWLCGAASVSCGLVWAAPAHADPPKVTSGVAVGTSAAVEGGAKAQVSVRSTGAPVTVAAILDRSVGVGQVGGNTATIITVHYQDICKSPCSFELDPGLRELAVHGPGVSGTSEKFELKPGPQSFVVDPGSAALAVTGYMLAVLGGVSLGVGVVVLIADPESSLGLPMTIGGGAGVAGGITLSILGSTSFGPDPQPAPAQRSAAGPIGVAWTGSF